MSLNEAQRKAVSHVNGPMLVLAGPGAGKTRVITERVKALVEQGTAPEHILVITFTRAAAGEMRGRFQALMEGRRMPVTFGTFHRIYFEILKQAYGYTGADILSEGQRRSIIRELVDNAHLDIEAREEFIADLAAEISSVKNGDKDIVSYHAMNCEDEVFRDIFKGYEVVLRRRRKLDFDDMLVQCLALLRSRADILAAWQRKFRYILIDEFQDSNLIQYEAVRLLAAPEDNLFAVGDDDQSVYRFRGARPEIMLRFEQDYPEAKRVLLNVNYRCTPQIVERSLTLIGHNKERFTKEVRSGRPPGAGVTVHAFSDEAKESEAIASLVKRYRRAGVAYNDMAVLYRTNTDCMLLTETLTEHKVPFRVKEHLPNRYEHWIARDICAYLRLTRGGMSRGDFWQIANRPKRYISRAAVKGSEVCLEELKEFYADKAWMCERIERLWDDLQFLSGMSPFAAVNYIRRGMDYEEFLLEYARERGQKSEDLLAVLDELQEAARPFRTVEEWFAHMREYGEELKKQEETGRKPMEGVELMTMHGSKGLEFRVVFILDANEGVTPFRRAVLDEDMEEERRLFYVAMTRAKDKLYLFYPLERRHRRAEPSRFLAELLGERL